MSGTIPSPPMAEIGPRYPTGIFRVSYHSSAEPFRAYILVSLYPAPTLCRSRVVVVTLVICRHLSPWLHITLFLYILGLSGSSSRHPLSPIEKSKTIYNLALPGSISTHQWAFGLVISHEKREPCREAGKPP
jgi:hypothetical protein